MVIILLLCCRYSERSKTKCIGITIETRPDYCLKKHLRFVILCLNQVWYLVMNVTCTKGEQRALFKSIFFVRCDMAWPVGVSWFLFLFVSSSMLMYGCTRLEIGVQSVYEDVARDTNRWMMHRSNTQSQTALILHKK